MRPATIAALLLVFALPTSRPALAQRFTQTNLVSDVSGEALRTDANLSNPWGIAIGASGVLWTSNNGSGTSSLLNPDGTIRSLVVSIPGGGNTGVVVTAASDSAFGIPTDTTDARAIFIFVSEAGTVTAWNPGNGATAVQVGSNSGAVYTGAAIASTSGIPRLYAADFGAGKIDVYDRNFDLVTTSGGFTDPNLPAGYFPFNIQNVGGQLYVAYAQKDPATGDEQAGAGLGVVDVYDAEGNLVRRFTSGGELNAPWAVVQAPADFGPFGGDVLVGNFGNGWINAYDAATGNFEGSLLDTTGTPVAIEGLWGLAFGLPVSGEDVAKQLYFAAGIDDEAHGLFGFLAAAADSDTTVTPPPSACEGEGNHSRNLAYWRNQCGGPRNPHAADHAHGGLGNHPGFGQGNGGGNRTVESDSLDFLLGCVAAEPLPNAFGAGGCFEAECATLQLVGRRSDRMRAAQELLTTRINLCSGAVCDSLPVTCEDEDGDGHGDVLSLGEVADSLDVLLCANDGHSDEIRHLTSLLRCVNSPDGEDEDGDDSGDDSRGDFMRKIAVKTPGMNPARLGSAMHFAISASQPAFVQLRIYDARGRLVAEPASRTMVVGSANVAWDGRDPSGRLVMPGTYFYRAVSGGDVANGRFVLVH